jgi:hypothetical protein
MINFGTIGPPLWDDAPVFIVGGGPSLFGFDFKRIAGKRHIIAVNQAMFDVHAECAVTVDHAFVRNRVYDLKHYAKFRPLYISIGNDPQKLGLPDIDDAIYIKSEFLPGLSEDPSMLHKGSTSGYAALGIAALKKAKLVILLGFDYSVTPDRHHYHNQYPWHHKANDQSWHMWTTKYEPAARHCLERGITVLNASPQSALPYFQKITLEDACAFT